MCCIMYDHFSVAWMTKPAAPPGCPPGLEYLSQVDQLIVKQQIELLESKWQRYSVELILGLRPANERGRYFITTSLIGWGQA